MTTRPALRFRASGDLTEGPPLRRMLLFCLPVVAGNVFQMLYGAADAAAVGRLAGLDRLAALGLS